jgi:hypothetical protein
VALPEDRRQVDVSKKAAPSRARETRQSMEVYPFEGGSKGLPLAVRPRGNKSADALVAWLAERPEETHNRLLEHGAILFRGFSIETPEDFERVARAIDPELKNEYLGTSPRDGLTDYVFSASELPSYYPIPQHCEMSFTGHPPRRLFFHSSISSELPNRWTPMSGDVSTKAASVRSATTADPTPARSTSGS